MRALGASGGHFSCGLCFGAGCGVERVEASALALMLGARGLGAVLRGLWRFRVIGLIVRIAPSA